MIDAWTWPAYVAVPFGIGIFAALFAPLLVLQSRRYGGLSGTRLVGAAAMAVYLTALAFYTIFPMPDSGWCAANVSPAVQWTPLHSLDDIAAAIDGLTYSQAARHVAVLQVVFNVLLFVPFGLLFRRLVGLGIVTTVLAGAATSLLIETTQGTGAFGLVGCAYRVADVDDLITNTLGTMLGVAFAPLVMRWVPDADRLIAERGNDRPVTRVRRLAAALIDVFLVVVVSTGLTVVYRAVVIYVLGEPVPSTDNWLNQSVPAIIAVGVAVLPALVGTRASLGQRALWLQPEGGGLACALRPWLGVGGYAVLTAIAVLPSVICTATATACNAAGAMLLVVSLLAIVFDRSARGLSFRLTGLGLTDVRAVSKSADVEAE